MYYRGRLQSQRIIKEIKGKFCYKFEGPKAGMNLLLTQY